MSKENSDANRVEAWQEEGRPLPHSLGRSNSKTPISSSEAHLMEEVKRCMTCKNTVKEQESTYLIWQGMLFCDTMCLHWYHKQNFMGSCSNCFSDISPDLVGTYVFRFDQLLQYCSVSCFEEYHSKRKSCLYCMGKILRFSVRVRQHNPLYCSQECFIKHRKSQGVTAILPDLDKACSICMSTLHSVTIHYQSVGNIKSICNQFCLQSFAYSLPAGVLLCAACKMYFSPDVLASRKGSTYTVCSKKCENFLIFSNLKIYSCGYCLTKRYDSDLIQRCSKFEPTAYMCSIKCFLQKYCAPKSTSIIQQLFTFDLSKITSANQPLTSKAIFKKTLNNFESNLLPLIMEENVTLPDDIINPTIATKTCFIVKSKSDIDKKNVATMCSVQVADKSSCVKLKTLEKSSQTDFPPPEEIKIPIPVPIYIPTPMYTFSLPVAKPVPFPLTIPVPIFVPITKKCSKKIFEDMRKILDQSPNNLLEQEVLAIAEAVSKDAREEIEDELILSESAVDAMFSDEMLDSANSVLASEETLENCGNINEKHSLDALLGIHAWRQWLKVTENVVLLVDSNQIDVLDFPSTQLADFLSLFVIEVRRPNGKSYAPDTIFYLCLSMQRYLFEHDRLDNIFFDNEYKNFTLHLDNDMRVFPTLFMDSPYIVTRVIEEHLWESRQLGAHSPYALLNTILYNNMKYFRLMTIEENMSMFLSNIEKTIKKKKGESGESQSILRYSLNKCEITSNCANAERCPIKLFELYCSKLPSVETEESRPVYFEPDSACSTNPVWYSTEIMDTNDLEMMMNRLRVVKELNVPMDEDNHI